ncbi:MAG: ABC transporter substrate-binding protein [Clostridia bacterium]|nr:ABC transporter substrate-binding protein [Clostridia bacterium]
MKKLISVLALVLSLVMILGLVGCAGAKEPISDEKPQESYTAIDMTVACLKGPTGVGMAKLMEDSANGKTANNYTFTVASAADEISGKIVKGEINIAAVPTNLAAKLNTKTEGKIKMLAVNTLGVLSILENGESIKSVADLKGKTIYSTGEGSNPEYILRYILSENGIDPDKDVTLQFIATNDELISALVSGKAQVAMVPEPAATTVLTKKDTLRRAISMNDEWEKLGDSSLMMGCLVALDSFVEANKEQVDKFLEEYKASVDYANNSIDDAAELCAKYEIVAAAPIAKQAIPYCNLTYVSGSEMKNSIVGYFEVLKGYDATSIGGALPDDSFYYGAE